MLTHHSIISAAFTINPHYSLSTRGLKAGPQFLHPGLDNFPSLSPGICNYLQPVCDINPSFSFLTQGVHVCGILCNKRQLDPHTCLSYLLFSVCCFFFYFLFSGKRSLCPSHGYLPKDLYITAFLMVWLFCSCCLISGPFLVCGLVVNSLALPLLPVNNLKVFLLMVKLKSKGSQVSSSPAVLPWSRDCDGDASQRKGYHFNHLLQH